MSSLYSTDSHSKRFARGRETGPGHTSLHLFYRKGGQRATVKIASSSPTWQSADARSGRPGPNAVQARRHL